MDNVILAQEERDGKAKFKDEPQNHLLKRIQVLHTHQKKEGRGAIFLNQSIFILLLGPFKVCVPSFPQFRPKIYFWSSLFSCE